MARSRRHVRGPVRCTLILLAGTGVIARATLAFCGGLPFTSRQPGLQQSPLPRRAGDADSFAEAEELARQAAALRAEAAELREAEEKERRSSRARQIVGSKADVDQKGLESWLKDMQNVGSAEAEAAAARLWQKCAAGKAALTLDDLTDNTFDAELSTILSEVREAAASAKVKMEEKRQKKVQEKQQMVEEGRELWTPSQLNDDKSTLTRVVAASLYLFPLLDSIYGVALSSGYEDEPILLAIVTFVSPLLAGVSIFPFGTQVMWFLLTLIANSRQLPRLLRFSIQQAVFLDAFYLVLSLLAGLEFYAGGGTGDDVGIGSILPVFAFICLVVSYCAISTLLGKEADSLPFISKYTSDWIDGPPPPGFGSGTD